MEEQIVLLSERPELKQKALEFVSAFFPDREWLAETISKSTEAKERLPQTAVLLREETIIGFCSLIADEEVQRPELTPWISHLWITESESNKGFAGKLLEFLRQLAASFGFQTVYLTSDRIEFYEKQGFREIGLSNFLSGRPTKIYRCETVRHRSLIFNGSPRKHGNTAYLIQTLREQLTGEVRIVNAYDCKISPCIDCRYCWTHEGCSIQDEMQEIYQEIERCDNVVIASAIQFSELSGALLAVTSRLQTYYAAKRIRKVKTKIKAKLGGVILCGGGDGSADRARDTASILLHEMNAKKVGEATSLQTDHLSAAQDEKALQALTELVVKFNDGVRK
ncbi:MAG TPA: GNAT family N-acetyltransferase [Bacillota bacterium]|nr:GNAT family N-acetyltransferase [Bacillota bacterium]